MERLRHILSTTQIARKQLNTCVFTFAVNDECLYFDDKYFSRNAHFWKREREANVVTMRCSGNAIRLASMVSFCCMYYAM